MEQNGSMKNKLAFVTGSTRGIGKATAAGLLAAGCKVWIHGKDEESCRQTCEELNANGWIALDLSEADAGRRLSCEVRSQIGSLDILINNAGIEAFNPFEEFDLELYDNIFQVNVRSAVSLTYGLLPLLKQSSNGIIINITSIHQEIPYPKNMAYSMSKAALAMFSRTLALELAPYNIRVNNFAPGAVRTEINREIIDQFEDKFREWIPLQRVAETKEMIGSILYLCSDSSSYTTGSTLFADGGYSLNFIRY